MKRLVVGLVAVERVLQERKGRTVGGREHAEEVVPPVEQALEAIERVGQLTTEHRDPVLVHVVLRPLGLDLVRGPLPHPVEPVEEDIELGPTRLVAGKEGRLRKALLEEAEDRGRVGEDVPVLDEHGNEILSAQVVHDPPIDGIDLDPFHLGVLVGEREGHPLDVGRVGNPEDADHYSTVSIWALCSLPE